MVPQLHIHHVVRYRSDAAWPAPIWGKLPPRAYTQEELDELISKLKSALADQVAFAATHLSA